MSEPPAGRVPADERLDADDRAARELDDRLVLEARARRARPPAQIERLELGPLGDAVAHPRPGTARGGPCRRSSPGTSRSRRCAAGRRPRPSPADRDGDADARADQGVDVRRAGSGARTASMSAVGDERRRRPRRPMSSRRTANSSPPSRAAVSPGRRTSASRSDDRAQQLVAAGVAEAVVDGLEVVEVEEQDRERRSPVRALRARACSTRSPNRPRLASPVRPSWNAWWRSSSYEPGVVEGHRRLVGQRAGQLEARAASNGSALASVQLDASRSACPAAMSGSIAIEPHADRAQVGDLGRIGTPGRPRRDASSLWSSRRRRVAG